MNIRPATPADSSLLSSLCMDVQCLHAEHHPGLFKLPQTDDFAVAYFDQMLADPLVNIFIAEEDGQALGYILCKLTERPETPFTFAMRFLLVDQISVRPQAQGRGVGSALLAQADDLAQESDVSTIQLNSWGFNTSAHAFFEHHGYEKFNLRFWREVE
jgi:ribosomal protein S18 acetylase RimI-like enzyme